MDDFEKAIYVRDIAVGANVTVISDEGDMVARVIPPRVEAEPVTGGGVIEGDEESTDATAEAGTAEGGASEG